uniref:Hsp90 co-chaperone Cdc37 n=1 Tax=Gallus gallus TaxID=9031 RepID=A0A8V0XA78_CHICK
MVDYSVWDHIEVSDDEDETHPNIDTASLFRWRHQARVERMEQFQKEKEELDKGCRECKRKLAECQKKLKELEVAEPGGGSGGVRGERERLQAEAQQLRHEERNWESKMEELRKKEKNMPWNVDTLSKDGFSKSVFNVKAEEKEETEEQKEQKHKTFVERHEKQIKHFGMLRRWDDSQKYLSDNPHLVCEETANYLVIWCIDLEVEEKQALMEQVAHQTIVMQFILELAKSLKVDPRACFRQFFTKIKTADQQYMEGFNDELEAFKERASRGPCGSTRRRSGRSAWGPAASTPSTSTSPSHPSCRNALTPKTCRCCRTPSAEWTPLRPNTTCSAASIRGCGSPTPKRQLRVGGRGGRTASRGGPTLKHSMRKSPKRVGRKRGGRGRPEGPPTPLQ